MGQPISKGPLLCLDIANKDEAVISLRSASTYVTATCLLFVCFFVCWFDICRKISHSFTQPLLLWQPQPLVDHSPTQLGSIKVQRQRNDLPTKSLLSLLFPNWANAEYFGFTQFFQPCSGAFSFASDVSPQVSKDNVPMTPHTCNVINIYTKVFILIPKSCVTSLMATLETPPYRGQYFRPL